MAAEISCAAFTRVIPTDDPSVAGFTNNGKRNFFLMAFSTLARSCSHSERRTARNGTIGKPACSNRRFCTSLSMPTADASTPAPTYGNPASSINPCTVPSSPNVPCKTGNTTSTPTLGCPAAGPNGTKVAALGSGGSTTRSPDFSTSANNFIELVPTSQRPSFEMPIGTASYFSGSSAPITEAAEASETSCSPERPPNSTPMRNRFCELITGFSSPSRRAPIQRQATLSCCANQLRDSLPPPRTKPSACCPQSFPVPDAPRDTSRRRAPACPLPAHHSDPQNPYPGSRRFPPYRLPQIAALQTSLRA